MYCTQCGSPNPDNAITCQSCSAKLINPYPGGSAPSAAGMPYGNPYQASSVPSSGGPSFGGSSFTGQRPQNYLAWAIVTTVCCGCLPFGIVAIVYAAQVDGKFASGDYAGAQASADSAKLWCMISFGLWCLGMLGYVALAIIGGFAGAGR